MIVREKSHEPWVGDCGRIAICGECAPEMGECPSEYPEHAVVLTARKPFSHRRNVEITLKRRTNSVFQGKKAAFFAQGFSYNCHRRW